MKSSISRLTLITDGSTGKMGLLQVRIFSSSRAYTSSTGKRPGLPKMTVMASILSKSFSQASMISPSCAAVPVARKSMGFFTDEPGKSFSLRRSAAGPSRGGTPRPSCERVSVSITAGPPAWVITAKRRPCGNGCIITPPTVTSSSRLWHRTMPALRKRASAASSLPAMAPVCEEAARLPAADTPAFTAAIRQPLRTSEAA